MGERVVLLGVYKRYPILGRGSTLVGGVSSPIKFSILVFQRSRSLSFWHTVSMAPLLFLGLGMPVTQPHPGLLTANGFEYILSGCYWVSKYPCIALLIIIVCINLAGD